MSNWALPTLTSTYTNLLTELGGRLNDLALGCDPALVTLTSPPTNTVRWNSASSKWEKFNGTVWADLAATYAINAASAAKWATGRTITLTGDATSTVSAAFDGSANLSFALTLATVNANVGSFGSASAVPIIAVNAKGLITSVATAALGTIATQAANSVAITGGAISATALTLVQSTTAAPTVEGRVEWDTDNDLLVVGNGVSPVTFAPINATVTLTNHTLGTGCVWGGSAVPLANGGTGATTAAAARTALGIGTLAVQADNAVAIVGGAISATALTLVQSISAAPTANGRVEWDSDNFQIIVGDGATSRVISPDNVTATITNKTYSTGCTWGGNAIPVANGGTGSTTAAAARTALGITYANLGVPTVAQGGTGASTFTSGGLLVGNGTAAIGVASAAQIVAAIGATSVTNATNATTAAACSGNSVTATTATSANALNAANSYTVAGLTVNAVMFSAGATSGTQFADRTTGTNGGLLYSNGNTIRLTKYVGAVYTELVTVNSTGDLTAIGNVTGYSDRKLKTDLTKLEGALDKVCQLVGYTYQRIDTGRRDTGLVAQDVLEVLPEAVVTSEDGTLALAYGNMMGLIVEAIKELRAEIARA